MNAPEIIRTERLVLRRYALEDAAAVFACYAQDPDVTRYMDWKSHRQIEETIIFVKGCVSAWDQGNNFTWAVTHPNGQLLGSCALRTAGCKADFGYVFGKACWGHGYATETLRSLITLAFTQQEIFRVWGTCDIANAASAHVMEKSGLQKEGVLRKWQVRPQMGNIPRDTLCYSITKDQRHA